MSSTLRTEIADDIRALGGFDGHDWLRAVVNTVLAPGLVARSTIHSCVYAINHAEPGAETTYALDSPPIVAEWWRPRDELQASLLSTWVLAWLSTPLASLPRGSLGLALLAAACIVPLALDLPLTLWRVTHE